MFGWLVGSRGIGLGLGLRFIHDSEVRADKPEERTNQFRPPSIENNVTKRLNQENPNTTQELSAWQTNIAVCISENSALFDAARNRIYRSSSNTAKSNWQQLRDQYPCIICRDVLAAPIVLNCEHTFCFICVENLMDKCRLLSCDESVEVVHQCPTCSSDFQNTTTFNRVLDVQINHDVDKFPMCSEKVKWILRKQAHTNSSKQDTQEDNENAEEKEKVGTQEKNVKVKADFTSEAGKLLTISVLAVVAAATQEVAL